MDNAEILIEYLKPELLNAFSNIPDYGSLGFIVHMHQGEPVRVEWSGSLSKKLIQRK